MGFKIATLAAIRLHVVNLWSRTSCGHTRLDLHHFMPEGDTDNCIPVEQPTINYKVTIPSKEKWEFISTQMDQSSMARWEAVSFVDVCV